MSGVSKLVIPGRPKAEPGIQGNRHAVDLGFRIAGDRKSQHSVRINKQWRICFRWKKDGPEDVEIVDYHD